jgi:hypothetical protein
MRKQTSSSTSATLSEHPNASKRIPFFLPINIHPPQVTNPPNANHINAPAHLSNGNNNANHTINGNGNINGNIGANNGNGNGMNQAPEDSVANYTLQGVLQWLNGEYRRYERERNAWEIERASLVV